MILVDKLPHNNNIEIKKAKVYINTLTPYFEFKNKSGRAVMPIKRCIKL